MGSPTVSSTRRIFITPLGCGERRDLVALRSRAARGLELLSRGHWIAPGFPGDAPDPLSHVPPGDRSDCSGHGWLALVMGCSTGSSATAACTDASARDCSTASIRAPGGERVLSLQNKLCHADDGIHWGAQFMGNVGEEVSLGEVCRLRLFLHLQQGDDTGRKGIWYAAVESQCPPDEGHIEQA